MTKEYVQASSFDQHKIPATSREQFVTLEISSEFPEQWITQGYTHIHFGAICLALSYHGRKGLPVAARLALLDTRYLEYQHACIGSLETTLNCGTVVVTFYSNFNMALDDPQLHHFLKVQLQITGADQVLDTYQATLHYQMAYRVQNHAFDLVLPVTNDALLITVDTNQKATAPMSQDRSQKTNCKNYFPLLGSPITKNCTKILFLYSPWNLSSPKKQMKGASSTTPPAIFSSISMVQPIHEPLPVPIESFSNTGFPVYSFAEDNHSFWDTCHCDSCSNEAMADKDDTPRHKRKSSGKKLKSRYINGDRTVDTLGQPSGKFDYLVKYTPPSWASPEQVPTVSMYQSTRPYDDDFPALQEQVKDKVRTLPQVQNPQGVDAEGRPKQVTQAEAVLNWQSQNAIAQNSVLHRIESKNCVLKSNKGSPIHEYLLFQASTGSRIDPQKEQEIQSLKIQLKSLQNELAKSKSKPSPFPEPSQNKMTSYYPDPFWTKHSLLSPHNLYLLHLNYLETQTLKTFSEKLSPNEIKGKPNLMNIPTLSSLYSLLIPIKLSLKSSLMNPCNTSEEETPTEESTLVTSDDDSSDTCSMPPLLMADPPQAHSSDPQSSRTRQEPPPTSTTRVSVDEPVSSDDEVNLNPRRYFTLDDIPRVKWRDRMLEFHSWLTSYMLKDGVTLRDALQQFTAKFSGTLWDWFHALGDYRQLQFMNSASLSEALGWLHYEFLGEALNDKEIARYEFFKMKCCSYLRSDLEKHFKEMCRRYHILSGPDDPSLKHAFLASIPRSGR
uniref:Uncharacterized protein n=1 Tax=Salix viminalis TaxID=40686 RepID=A0A6N2MSM9_SALVM